MSSQKIYKLAMFENEIGEWVFINRPFIIENSSLLSGIFLRDTWFCYKIEKKKYYNDEHFMILEIDNPNDFDKTLELINRKHENNRWRNKPSIGDKPPDYNSNFSRYFHITRKMIKNAKKQIELEKKDSHIIKLYDDNCLFKIELMKFDNEFMLSLPRFNLF
jgi:hypothetical protein